LAIAVDIGGDNGIGKQSRGKRLLGGKARRRPDTGRAIELQLEREVDATAGIRA